MIDTNNFVKPTLKRMSNTLTIDQPSNIHLPDWNDSIEKMIKDIGESCKSYKIMHLNTARVFNYRYTRYMKLGIILGPLAGLLSGSSITFKDYHTLFSLMVTIFGFFSGVVVAILRFGNYEEVGLAHKMAAARYTSLESSIRSQLSLFRDDRSSAKDYLEWINNSFNELFLDAPLVPDYQYNKFVLHAKTEGLNIPAKYQDTVEINMDYENSKIQEIFNKSIIKINRKKSSRIIVEKRNNTKFQKIQNFQKSIF